MGGQEVTQVSSTALSETPPFFSYLKQHMARHRIRCGVLSLPSYILSAKKLTAEKK
jgi:hypothetical protein